MTLPGKVDLNILSVFAAVVEAGSFTAASEQLNVNKAKVSIQIKRLEQSLGADLFHRTTRRITLTDAGRQLYNEGLPHLEGLQSALSDLQSSQAEITGTLRLTSTHGHIDQYLGEAVADFAAEHPHLQIEVRTSDQPLDLVSEGIDLAIRLGWPRDSTLKAVKLADLKPYVVASPEYLASEGTPQTPQDLAEHDWIALTLLRTPQNLTFTSQDGATEVVKVQSRLRVDSGAALRALLRSGRGISALAHFASIDEIRSGRLVHVLKDWSLPSGGVFAVFPSQRHVSAAVRAFIDFYRQRLRNVPMSDAP